MVDRNFAPGREAKRRYGSEWQAYVDELTVRTGKCVDGVCYTDGQMTDRLKAAVAASAKKQVGQPPEEALAAFWASTSQSLEWFRMLGRLRRLELKLNRLSPSMHGHSTAGCGEDHRG